MNDRMKNSFLKQLPSHRCQIHWCSWLTSWPFFFSFSFLFCRDSWPIISIIFCFLESSGKNFFLWIFFWIFFFGSWRGAQSWSRTKIKLNFLYCFFSRIDSSYLSELQKWFLKLSTVRCARCDAHVTIFRGNLEDKNPKCSDTKEY